MHARVADHHPATTFHTVSPRTWVNTSRGRQATLRQRLDSVAGSDPTARQYVGSQSASVYKATHHSGPRQPFEVRTRLAPALAVALDLPYPEASSDELVQRDAPHDEVTPSFDGRQIYAFGGQLLQRFGLHKCEIVADSFRVREGPCLTLVAIAQEATPLDGLCRGHRPHGIFGLGGQRDQLDHANAIRTRTGFGPPPRVVLREYEGGIHGRVLLLLVRLS